MDYATARHNMVEGQIRPGQVTDATLLAAMAELPREAFVAEAQAPIAYADRALPLGSGRAMMAPLVLARLLQAAAAVPGDMALVIGCAGGYSAAVLARLANTVVAVEEDAELAARAIRVLAEQGIDNVAVMEAPLAEGFPRQAPYDVILMGGAVAEIPRAIADQLAEGGRLVAVLAGTPGIGRGTLMTRRGEDYGTQVLFDAATPSLPGFAPGAGFQFQPPLAGHRPKGPPMNEGY